LSSIIEDQAHVVELKRYSTFKVERWQGEWAGGVSIREWWTLYPAEVTMFLAIYFNIGTLS